MLRRSKKLFSFSLSILGASILSAHAHPAQHVIVAPNCLISHLKINYQTLAEKSDLALISIRDQDLVYLIKNKHQQKKPCGGFINVTKEWQAHLTSNATHHSNKALDFLSHYTNTTNKESNLKTTHQYEIRYPLQVYQLLQKINPQQMWNNLTTLTQFNDRYADSDNGVKAAQWFKDQIESLAKTTGQDVTVSYIKTNYYQQPSVVAKFGNSSEPGIVIGGHMDTLSSTYSKKPGADDDGSGSVTVLEVARTILSSGMTFKKPIYFVWYSAEEEGLVGSQNVVAEFKKKNIPIDAVLHFDMTGYAYKNSSAMWLIKDYVNQDLTAFLEKLIKTYVKQSVQYTMCGYACSDHASWNQAGFAAAIPFESSFSTYNPNIHSSNDSMNILSLIHMTDFVKLGTAFAVELAEPKV